MLALITCAVCASVLLEKKVLAPLVCPLSRIMQALWKHEADLQVEADLDSPRRKAMTKDRQD